MEDGLPVAVAPALTLTDPDPGDTIDGASIALGAGFASSQDRLGINGSSSGSVGSISYSYDGGTGIMKLYGAALPADYQAILRQVTYWNTSQNPSETQRAVEISIGGGLYFEPNGHFYEFVTAPGINWTDAKDAAALRRYFGLQGYLVTVMSAAENGFVASKLQGQGWMGGSDASSEGSWFWMTGPEAGTPLCNGQGTCVPVGGAYTNWHSDEPNNAGDEDYAHFLSDGTWNDWPLAGYDIAGYVAEYGGMSGDPSTDLTAQVAVNVQAVNDAPVAVDDPTPTTDEVTPIDINVLGNDTDVDNALLQIEHVGVPDYGTVSIVANRARYVPANRNADYTAVFTYTANDGALGSNVATVTVTVDGSIPVAYVDPSGTDDPDHGAGQGSAAFATLQYAVDAVEDGGTVWVGCGQYDEQVTIDKAVSILSDCRDGARQAPRIDGGGAGNVLTVHASDVTLCGLTLQNGETGLRVESGANVRIQGSNIISQTVAGISTGLGASTVMAERNYWGAADGPSGLGTGAGTGAYGAVAFDPWERRLVLGATCGAVPASPAALDGRGQSDAWITAPQGGPDAVLMLLAGNPYASMFNDIGKYYHVTTEECERLGGAQVRFYLTAADLARFETSTLKLRWWNGSTWGLCAPVTVNLAPEGGYAGYVELTLGLSSMPNPCTMSDGAFALEAWTKGDPNPPVSLTVAPQPFCPTWTLHYTYQFTNSYPVALTSLVVTDVLPVELCCAEDGLGTDKPAAISVDRRVARWNVGTVAAGQTVTLVLDVHPLSTIHSGQVISNTMTYSYMADVLPVADAILVTAQADTEECGPGGVTGPTPTPTLEPSPTPTITPTPTDMPASAWLYLPLILRGE